MEGERIWEAVGTLSSNLAHQGRLWTEKDGFGCCRRRLLSLKWSRWCGHLSFSWRAMGQGSWPRQVNSCNWGNFTTRLIKPTSTILLFLKFTAVLLGQQSVTHDSVSFSKSLLFLFDFKKNYFSYLVFLAVLGFCCCGRTFSLVVVHGLLIVAISSAGYSAWAQ